MAEYTIAAQDVVRFAEANDWNRDTIYQITEVTAETISFEHYGKPDTHYTKSRAVVEALEPYVVDPSEVSEQLSEDERLTLALAITLDDENGNEAL